MNPVQGTSAVTSSSPPLTTPTAAAANESLMPAPSADNIDDSMTAVYVLMAKQQSNDMTLGKAGVQIDKKKRDKASADEKAARTKEEDNSSTHGTGFFGSIGKLAKDVGRDALHGRVDKIAGDTVSDVKSAAESPKFWSDLEKGAKTVATVAAAVAGVAATIATAGAAGPLVVGAALALSAGGFAVSETNCLGKASAYVGLGMGLAGAAVSFGATAGSTASAGGMQILAKVGVAGGIASGGADVVSGGAHIENTKFEANVANAQADEAQATNKVADETRLSQWLLENLSAGQQAERDAMGTLQGIVQQHDTGKVTLASIATRG
jgi:hypothetical protein